MFRGRPFDPYVYHYFWAEIPKTSFLYKQMLLEMETVESRIDIDESQNDMIKVFESKKFFFTG